MKCNIIVAFVLASVSDEATLALASDSPGKVGYFSQPTLWEKVFQSSAAKCIGRSFMDFLTPKSRTILGHLIRELNDKNKSHNYLWIPGGLTAIRGDGNRDCRRRGLGRLV